MARVLRPSGYLLDMRPIAGAAPVDVLGEGKPKTVYVIDGSPSIPDDAAWVSGQSRLVFGGNP